MQKGNIGVTTENIFPIIKKFLYSDHEIFLRELVSNAVDATQKLNTLASIGEFKGELGDLTIHVELGKDTITISDRGIGLTAEEIEKYINQIAFSGANDFLEKYKDDANAIIGHFGLGFYSAFMVAKKVEIITKSYRDEAQAIKWTCDGSPEFTIEEVDKADRGSDIILYIDDDCKEFLEEARVSELLKKYCTAASSSRWPARRKKSTLCPPCPSAPSTCPPSHGTRSMSCPLSCPATSTCWTTFPPSPSALTAPVWRPRP